MGLYRKRPIVVEAFQLGNWFRTDSEKEKFEEWAKKHGFTNWWWGDVYLTIDLGAPDGVLYVRVQDWIVKGVEGEFYPVTESVFKKTYESAETIHDG